MKINIRILKVCYVLLMLMVVVPMSASAKPVSITINKVACASHCRNEGLETAGESAPDFYAKVFINGIEHITSQWPDNQDIVTDPKTIIQNVPDN